MKKTIFSILAVLMAGIGIQAVADDYLPLVREGVRWHYNYFIEDGNWRFFYEFKGDTIINGNVYKKLYRTFVDGPNNTPFDVEITDKTTLECCMMEQNKVVYAVYENEYSVYEMDVRFHSNPIVPGAETEYGVMLYDFNQPSEDITGYCTIQGVKCNQYATKLLYNYQNEWFFDMELIEGFGYKKGDYLMSTLPYPYNPRPACNCGWTFVKFTNTNDNVLFNPYKDIFNGINNVKVDAPEKDSNYYNMQGQAVDIKSAPAGIYIHGGKKVVVK